MTAANRSRGINALWFLAWKLWLVSPAASNLLNRSAKLARALRKFWNAPLDTADVIGAPGIGNDASLRPSRFLLFLCHRPASRRTTKQLLDACRRLVLLTDCAASRKKNPAIRDITAAVFESVTARITRAPCGVGSSAHLCWRIYVFTRIALRP